MKKPLNIVKVGGAVVENDASLNTLLAAFCAIKGNKMLVTGGGKIATKMAADLGIAIGSGTDIAIENTFVIVVLYLHYLVPLREPVPSPQKSLF